MSTPLIGPKPTAPSNIVEAPIDDEERDDASFLLLIKLPKPTITIPNPADGFIMKRFRPGYFAVARSIARKQEGLIEHSQQRISSEVLGNWKSIIKAAPTHPLKGSKEINFCDTPVKQAHAFKPQYGARLDSGGMPIRSSSTQITE